MITSFKEWFLDLFTDLDTGQFSWAIFIGTLFAIPWVIGSIIGTVYLLTEIILHILGIPHSHPAEWSFIPQK